ncbi:PLP-dependent aminotransferase family protein [Paenibacillus silvae]|uniref:aminotransferase-like domain-containing protein n=1 Tax=Paenibacillus silvae TaxID=1325358 RepID=UPI0011A1EFB3|nr:MULTISPECIES: PLP-dependent aminotransferase family protein [Paenibacillus]MCK6075460.1 PLP-dependent aminotransferase family protein [Paenibacillus silvae]MCK6149847.1 PLP-dependent aminotransferase family protein [Paenibacillus silvae]MCK6268145.1 PLP-dependent aminotransferase family protein [Paenibacillus silvae]
MSTPWSKMAQNTPSSVVRDMLQAAQAPGMISLAGGLPAQTSFPLEAIRTAYEKVFMSGSAALQYAETEGYRPLRVKIAERLEGKGLPASPDHMLLTTGSQQSIDLVCRILLDPGDSVLVESPTYLAALQVIQSYQGVSHGVACDDHGMLPESLEEQLQLHRPKLVYINPTFSNPTGKVWSRERRQQAVDLCRKYGVLILEDDPYGEIRFNPEQLDAPALAALDAASYEGPSNVIYTSTFSKTVAPGLRTGWILAAPDIVKIAARAKQGADLHSSSIDQRALHALLETFDLDAHIRYISQDYEQRMRTLTELMSRKSWEGITWNSPQGGMFLWLTLPEGMLASNLFTYGIQEKVCIVPGDSFYAGTPELNRMRINFTHTDPELLPEAVERMDRAIQRWHASSQSDHVVTM